MSVIEKSIEVDVPVRTAYNQWTQFEEFPKFMKGVESVKQIDDVTLKWDSKIAGVDRQWTAKIDEQTPDQRVAWHSIEGTKLGGAVTFHRLDDAKTKVMLQMEFEPEDWAEKAGDITGTIEQRVQDDLKNFKQFIEERGTETGAWRGEVKQEKVTR